MIAIQLPNDIEKRLEVLAKRTGRSTEFYVQEAVIDHLEELEDIYFSYPFTTFSYFSRRSTPVAPYAMGDC